MQRFEVAPERLRWQCDPERFSFVCTDELDPLAAFLGQERATRALEFGLAMDRPGYNIFVTGLTGTGRASAIQTYIQRTIAQHGVTGIHRAQDWCYYYNFADPDRPELIALPQGRGKQFRTQCEELLRTLRDALTRALAGPAFEAQGKAITEAGQAQSQMLFTALEQRAQEMGFQVRMQPQGVQLIPQQDGRPLTQEEFMALPDERKSQLQQNERQLAEAVEEAINRTRALQREGAERLRALVQQTADLATVEIFQRLAEEYADFPKVVAFFQGLRQFTLDHLDLFQPPPQEAQPPVSLGAAVRPGPEGDPFIPFRINVFVDSSNATAPPVIIEPNPTYGNLFGKIERRVVMNALVSDHTMLKPGALATANGGYLIINSRKALLNPGVWEGLKIALRTREIRLEDPFETIAPGVVAPQGIRPAPMPLSVKVIMTGQAEIFNALSGADEEFWEVFKVRADFDAQIDRTEEHLQAYAQFICSSCNRNDLLHFHRTAVAQVAEYAARVVGDQDKLTSRFGPLEDVLIEADYWARRHGHTMVMGEDVDHALHERIYRLNLIEERIREMITNGTVMVDVAGSVTGQINGLAVFGAGGISFGQPTRITVRTFLGRPGVVNIERESQMSGRTHDKGVLILSGYLGHKFAQDKPLSVSASICFEQSYSGVDGDSASSTELYALLSSLAGLPIRQDIAVTGSVNQQGEVQAIGGVNEKIEGFYMVCKEKGLTGTQGVLIPEANVRNLMLREDVVKACREGQFHVWAVRTIDEGIEVLTGVPAGDRAASGGFPEGTVNALVDRRLREVAEGIRDWNAQHDR